MQQNFNNIFNLINEINVTKEDILHNISLLESIEKIENETDEDNKNITKFDLVFKYLNVSTGSNVDGNNEVVKLLESYFQTNIFNTFKEFKTTLQNNINAQKNDLNSKVKELQKELEKE